jgi:hypothetical protein
MVLRRPKLVHEVVRLLMRGGVRGHRVDDGGVVHLFGDAREILADTHAIGTGLDGLHRTGDLFVIGLRVPGVEMALAAGHVEEDDITGGGGLFRSGGTFTHGERLTAKQMLHGWQHADAEAGLCHARHHGAAGEVRVKRFHRFVGGLSETRQVRPAPRAG